jgi:hypothetical protein
MPDFGFNNYLDFGKENDQLFGWTKFMDCVNIFPKHERVQNYIAFINEIKIKEMMKKNKN